VERNSAARGKLWALLMTFVPATICLPPQRHLVNTYKGQAGMVYLQVKL